MRVAGADIVFTFDDYQSGQVSPPYLTPPNRVVSIREERYKLAEYYDVNGVVPSQWEMYDLRPDPLETNNIAYRLEKRTREQQRQFERLTLKLAASGRRAPSLSADRLSRW